LAQVLQLGQEPGGQTDLPARRAMVPEAGSRARTALLATTVVLCGAVIAATSKLISEGVPACEQLFVRSLLCLAASPLLGGSGLGALRRSRSPGRLLLRGVLGFLASLCSVEALRALPLNTFALLTRLHPLVGPALLRLFSGEGLLPQHAVGYAIAAVGVSVGVPEDTWRATSPLAFGYNYGLATTVLTALSFAGVSRMTRLGEDPAAVRAAFHVAGLLGSLACGLGLGAPGLALPGARDAGLLALGAAAASGLQLGLSHLFDAPAPAAAVPCLLLLPVFSAALGALLGQGPPTWQEALAFVLISAGVGIGQVGAGAAADTADKKDA